MISHDYTSNNSLNKQSKDNDFKTQLKTIFEYLQEHVATASMVSDATGIPQKNICRYKRDLELAGRLWEIEKNYVRKQDFEHGFYLPTPNTNQSTLLTN